MSQSDSASRLDLHLLGPPQMIRNGQRVIGFRSAKAQALLYYLAITGRPQRRSTLAALLWPEADDVQAGASLRNVLSNLRALVGDCLTATRETVVLHGEWLWADAAQFDALLRRTGDTDIDMVQMEAAVSLYRGEFLEGFHVSGAPEFEQWATVERERLRQAVLNSLLALADWHVGQADYVAGLEDVNRLLAIDPANEPGYRQKMLMLARMGQRGAALQQYDMCRRMLTEELGVEPSPQTIAVYELILAGALEVKPQTAGGLLRTAPEASGAWPLPASTFEPVTPRLPRIDRRDMPERVAYYGRQEDLVQLRNWLAADETRLVAISGMGGIGKTTLAAESVARLAPSSFDFIGWRSLVNAPPLDVVLDAWLQSIAGGHLDRLPESMEEKQSMLLDELGRQRCLLVLDNLESIIDPGDRAVRFRTGYEEYGQLLDRMAQTRHRSCLLLTTRDLPDGLRGREEDSPRVRILPLAGLSVAPAVKLLRDRGVSAPDAILETLAGRYSGNPLALKLVADTVRDLFGNDVSAFLGEEMPVFADIRTVLDQQFGRLSELGREIITWLAIERQPVTVQTLWQDLARPPRRAEFLETMRTLQNGSLVEVVTGDSAADGTQLALQNVVMEYLTERLVKTLSDEIETGRMVWLHRHALVKAQCPAHIQDSQRRLLLEPTARWLVTSRGRSGAVEHLRNLLFHLRQEASHSPGYAAANILHLLLHLETDLNGWDISGLVIRQADLRSGLLAGVDFRGADLSDSMFAEIFGVVGALAISPDGRYLAAGAGDGRVFVWQMTDYRSLLMLQGHTHGISSLAFSPHDPVLASGGLDGKVCLWNTSTGEALAALPAHRNTIGCVAFSPDGIYLASGAADGQVGVWDWRRGEVYRRVEETASINGLAFSPDGRWLISAKDDGQANVWDWRGGTLLRTLNGHGDKLRSVVFSPDGAIAATGGEDRRICLWELTDPAACRILEGHNGWVCSLAFSPDGKNLASASTDQTVRIWDTATGQTWQTLIGHTGWVTAVAYSPDGKLIATGGYDQTVRLWEAQTGLALRSFQGYQRPILHVSFSSDGALLASGSLDGPAHLWDVRSRRHLHRLTGHRGAIRALAFSEINQVLAGGCDDHRVYLWDLASGRLKRTLTGHTDLVRHLAFSPDGKYLVTGSYDRTLRIWEMASCRLRHIIHGAMAKIQSAFCAGGGTLAYCGDDGAVKLLDPNSGKVLESLSVCPEQPVVVAFSPQGQLLVCGTACGALWVWQMNDGCADRRFALRFHIQLSAQNIWRILFSPNGKLLAIGDSSGPAQIIDLASGEVLYSLPDVLGAYDLAFGGDGEHLATAGADGTIHIHDAATGEVRRTLPGHLADVTCLEMSPVEDMIASGSVDGDVRLWSLATGACLATLAPPGLYAGMNITDASGITTAQRATLIALGAIER